MKKPYLSIIAPHYQPAVSDDRFRAFIQSIKQPGDFEVLIYHDGPLDHPLDVKLPRKVKFVETPKRFNDWGHSLRDIGIKEASGEYILHTNADNTYKGILAELIETIKTSKHDSYTMPIMMRGVATLPSSSPDTISLFRTHNPEDRIVLMGEPKPGSIDVMQYIMKRSLWLKYGGWYDKTMNSDGIIYEKFSQQHPPTFINAILGEHW